MHSMLSIRSQWLLNPLTSANLFGQNTRPFLNFTRSVHYSRSNLTKNAWSRIHSITARTARIPYSHVTTSPVEKVIGRWPGIPTLRRDIKPGSLIWGSIKLDPAAIRLPQDFNPYSDTDTARIYLGKPTNKLSYVLEADENYVFAAYATTLHDAANLGDVVDDIRHWYPVSPAPRNGLLEPLDPVDGRSAWIYLGAPVVIRYEPLNVLSQGISEKSLALLRSAMLYERFEVM